MIHHLGEIKGVRQESEKNNKPNKNMFKHELGKLVKDKVTELDGIITSRSECLYGCNRYFIQPKAGQDKKVPDGWWVDEEQIDVIGDGVWINKIETYTNIKWD